MRGECEGESWGEEEDKVEDVRESWGEEGG